MSGQVRREPFGAILVCSLLLVIVAVGGGGNPARPPSATVLGEILISGNCGNTTTFNVCGPTTGNGPYVYPGAAAATMPITFYNPLNVDISVYQLTVTFIKNFPPGSTSPRSIPPCLGSAFHVGGPGATLTSTGTAPDVMLTFNPYLLVPKATGSRPGSVSYNSTLAMDNSGRQDACQKLLLTMNYSAKAYFTVPTSTALVASPSPSFPSQTVTLTATVFPTINQTVANDTPTGTVTFYQCMSATCNAYVSPALGSAALNSSGVASIPTSFAAVGTYYVQAVYAPNPSDNHNFAPSTSSPPRQQVVGYTSCITGSQNGGYTVPSGKGVCVTSTGKVNGGVTVPSGSYFYLNGGTINGGVTVNAGGSFYLTGGTVTGDITLQSPGATFVMNGGTVNGNISTAHAKRLQICGALNINGTVTASGTTSYVVIGDGAAGSTCAANKITGAVILTNNTSGVEVSLNSITGNLTLTGNAGGTTGESANEVEANKVTGNLACTTNTTPPINDGKPNTVSGSRTGQCAGF